MSIGKKSKSQVTASRPIVYERDGRKCVAQGTLWPCHGSITLQHRVGKGAGGSAQYDAPAFLVCMCGHHNSLAESSADFANFCVQNGYSLRRSLAEQHPIARVPIRYPDGWHLLSGNIRSEISESTAIDLMAEIYGEEL
jgi:hypothetical protein